MITKTALILTILVCLSAMPGYPAGKTRVFGVVGRAEGAVNPVSQAAAEAEAVKLVKDRGVRVVIDWRTPKEMGPAGQVREIEALVDKGVIGIVVWALDVNALGAVIDRAIAHNVEVVIIGGDEQPKCLAVVGMKEKDRGVQVMRELAKELGNKVRKGPVAILAGDTTAMPGLLARVEGAREEAQKHPPMKIQDVYHCRLDPENAARIVSGAWRAHPDIVGWAMVAGWALFEREGAIPWPPGDVIVSAYDDFVESELDYVKKGYIQVLLVDNFYQWSATSIDVLYDKVVENKNPASRFIQVDPIRVTKENAEEFLMTWHRWHGKGA